MAVTPVRIESPSRTVVWPTSTPAHVGDRIGRTGGQRAGGHAEVAGAGPLLRMERAGREHQSRQAERAQPHSACSRSRLNPKASPTPSSMLRHSVPWRRMTMTSACWVSRGKSRNISGIGPSGCSTARSTTT